MRTWTLACLVLLGWAAQPARASDDPDAHFKAMLRRDFPGKDPYRNLLAAATIGDRSLVRRYLVRGLDVNHRYVWGVRLLMVANANVLDLLLAHGARVDEKDVWENTALTYAVGAGKLAAARILLAHGAKVDGVRGGDPPLTVAAGTYSAMMVLFLLKHHARVDARDREGHTALMKAAYGSVTPGDSLAFVRLLIANGANPRLKDPQGHTALYIARAKDVRAYLQQIEGTKRGSRLGRVSIPSGGT